MKKRGASRSLTQDGEGVTVTEQLDQADRSEAAVDHTLEAAEDTGDESFGGALEALDITGNLLKAMMECFEEEEAKVRQLIESRRTITISQTDEEKRQLRVIDRHFRVLSGMMLLHTTKPIETAAEHMGEVDKKVVMIQQHINRLKHHDKDQEGGRALLLGLPDGALGRISSWLTTVNNVRLLRVSHDIHSKAVTEGVFRRFAVEDDEACSYKRADEARRRAWRLRPLVVADGENFSGHTWSLKTLCTAVQKAYVQMCRLNPVIFPLLEASKETLTHMTLTLKFQSYSSAYDEPALKDGQFPILTHLDVGSYSSGWIELMAERQWRFPAITNLQVGADTWGHGILDRSDRAAFLKLLTEASELKRLDIPFYENNTTPAPWIAPRLLGQTSTAWTDLIAALGKCSRLTHITGLTVRINELPRLMQLKDAVNHHWAKPENKYVYKKLGFIVKGMSRPTEQEPRTASEDDLDHMQRDPAAMARGLAQRVEGDEAAMGDNDNETVAQRELGPSASPLFSWQGPPFGGRREPGSRFDYRTLNTRYSYTGNPSTGELMFERWRGGRGFNINSRRLSDKVASSRTVEVGGDDNMDADMGQRDGEKQDGGDPRAVDAPSSPAAGGSPCGGAPGQAAKKGPEDGHASGGMSVCGGEKANPANPMDGAETSGDEGGAEAPFDLNSQEDSDPMGEGQGNTPQWVEYFVRPGFRRYYYNVQTGQKQSERPAGLCPFHRAVPDVFDDVEDDHYDRHGFCSIRPDYAQDWAYPWAIREFSKWAAQVKCELEWRPFEGQLIIDCSSDAANARTAPDGLYGDIATQLAARAERVTLKLGGTPLHESWGDKLVFNNAKTLEFHPKEGANTLEVEQSIPEWLTGRGGEKGVPFPAVTRLDADIRSFSLTECSKLSSLMRGLTTLKEVRFPNRLPSFAVGCELLFCISVELEMVWFDFPFHNHDPPAPGGCPPCIEVVHSCRLRSKADVQQLTQLVLLKRPASVDLTINVPWTEFESRDDKGRSAEARSWFKPLDAYYTARDNSGVRCYFGYVEIVVSFQLSTA
ncbi:unnamed protein product [Vitrella brassicaformis CCMP3155]|uniref:WW domain-containing protein n=1 Tax=Vitrella brassicaformis (strain CCMP3155) TaxID=1169540 RepID=A0A0G4EQY3_VITBC|nr:unnamed protein product [Vitrella brassicaformis CCMP3155]|eukprot:CEL99894.1 unnamed protein product [Vitrella brassicaformis CCMP3155]